MGAMGRISTGLLLGLLATVLALKGGVHPRHSAWVLIGIGMLGAWSLLREGPLGQPGLATKALMLLLGLGVLLQVLPLPAGLRAGISPGTQILLERVTPVDAPDSEAYWERVVVHDLEVALGGGPSDLVFDASLNTEVGLGARPVSLDPNRTRWVLATWLAAMTVFLLACRIARGPFSQLLLTGLFALCVAEALWGLLYMSGGSLGFFPKEHYLGSASGTLVNRNHFATLMLLGLGTGGALFWGEAKARGLAKKGLCLVGLGLCGAALLATQSRAGILLGVGWVLWIAAHWTSGRARAGLLRLAVFGLGAIAIGLAWQWGFFERVEGGFSEDASLQGRLDIWSHAIGQWRGFLFSGCGLGGFTWVASTGHEAPYLFHFSHLHNDVLQLFLEGGLLIGAPVFVFLSTGLGTLFGAFLKKGRKLGDAALLGAIVAVLLHSFVDFPLQIPGILLALAACAGLLWGVIGPAGGPPSKKAHMSLLLLLSMGLVSLQAAKRDQIQADTLALLARPGPPDLGELEVQLSRETAGAREGLGRLALMRAERITEGAGDQVSLKAFVLAAAASRRRVLDQNLDGNAHLAEALAWSRAAVFARRIPLQSDITSEEMAHRAEAALARALTLQASNPRVLLEAAKVHIYLSRSGPLKHSHEHRAALALTRAVHADPWMAARGFRIADSLQDTALSRISHEDARVRYEEGLAWRRRGRLSKARSAIRASLHLDGEFAAAHFALGDLTRQEDGVPAAKVHYQAFLDRGEAESGMGAWSAYWLGESERAIGIFRRLLQESPENPWFLRGLELALLGKAQPAPF
jgi:O-antigen ligase/tetratricopeptide (TPR) repeat protein